MSPSVSSKSWKPEDWSYMPMQNVLFTERQVHPGEFAKRMLSIQNGEGLDGGSKRLLAQYLVDETLLGLGYGEGLAILDKIRKQV